MREGAHLALRAMRPLASGLQQQGGSGNPPAWVGGALSVSRRIEVLPGPSPPVTQSLHCSSVALPHLRARASNVNGSPNGVREVRYLRQVGLNSLYVARGPEPSESHIPAGFGSHSQVAPLPCSPHDFL